MAAPRIDAIEARIFASTVLSVANNAVTNVLSVAAFKAGEMTGYVSITATSSIRFLVKIQYSKNAAGSDYNLSYQTSGETPVSGFLVKLVAYN